MKFSSVSIQKGSILIAAAGAALASCILSLPPAMSAPEEGTNNRGLQNNESKGKDGAQSAEPGTGNPTPAAEKKKNPFGTKPKGPVGNALLETKRPLVKAWKVNDLLKKVEGGLTNRDFDRGKKLYTEAKCVLCHTYGRDQGGFIGPALTEVGARFGAVDILYAVIEPSKDIADAYKQRTVIAQDGRSFTGMVSQIDGDMQITENILDPDRKIIVSEDNVESIHESKVSPMPEGLLNTLNEEEIFDLIAYVISRNDPEDEMFKPVVKNK
jgi:putative heme-binding domain-containing protein